jgi:hypothetical protein
MCCPNWWKRKVTTLQRKAIESVARDIGLVHNKKSTYSSAHTQLDRVNQKTQTEKYLQNTHLSNDNQEVYCLKDLYDKSVSNPYIRRAELMTRVNGFEIVADQLGDCGEFYTITTPSRMHARLKRTGAENPKYDGTSPIEANEYLQTIWSRIRSKLHRDGLYVYGFRVAEPNHDGTPHWHMLLFMKPEIRKKVRRIIKSYALQSDPHERGARKHRFKAEAIDKEKGSAAAYIAKYIVKNIDGSHIDQDLYGNDSKSAAAAIDAWASCWGIRQFQQIGGPSVGVWRELRRLASQSDEESLRGSLLGEAASNAAAADWAAYVMVMGGPILMRKDRPIKPFYEEPETVDEETGEVLEDGLTVYGDPASARIKGLVFQGSPVITRFRKWVVTNGPPPLRGADRAFGDSHSRGGPEGAPLDLYQ